MKTACCPSIPGHARSLGSSTRAVATLPILSPHGHVDPRLLLADEPFSDPAELFITRDHYITRLLHSAGIDLAALGAGPGTTADPRAIWTRARRELASAGGDGLGVLAHARTRHALRHRRRAVEGDRRRHLRRHRVAPRRGGLPSACALRSLRHRGAGDDGRPARRPGGARRPRRRLLVLGPRPADLPTGRLPRPHRAGLRRARGATHGDQRHARGRLRRLPRRPSKRVARTSSTTEPSRPTTGCSSRTPST